MAMASVIAPANKLYQYLNAGNCLKEKTERRRPSDGDQPENSGGLWQCCVMLATAITPVADEGWIPPRWAGFSAAPASLQALPPAVPAAPARQIFRRSFS